MIANSSPQETTKNHFNWLHLPVCEHFFILFNKVSKNLYLIIKEWQIIQLMDHILATPLCKSYIHVCQSLLDSTSR